MVSPGHESLLGGLRVVDLAGEPAAMTGRILADLGAEVVLVEPPEGHPLRRAHPLGPDGTSLRFAAWAAGKYSVVVEGPTDPKLATYLKSAEIVISTPGWPGVIDMDPTRHLELAPRAVWMAVTPFGMDGPRSNWKASDLGVMASSGNMYCTGDPDRPPVRCSEPTAWAHVGPEAAMAALSALAAGAPCFVDVSAQEAVMIASMGQPGRFARSSIRGRRSGTSVGATREIWPCKDGWVSFGLRGGKARLANLETITRLVATDPDIDASALLDRDWSSYNHNRATPEELEAISAPIGAWFAKHTMSELYAIACESKLMLAPTNTPRELLESAQLEARELFGELGGIQKFVKRWLVVNGPVGQDGKEQAPALPQSRWASQKVPGANPPALWPASPMHATDAGTRNPRELDLEPAWVGTHILEFGSGAAGPIATRYFAEHGATVVRIESRTRPDFLRTYGLWASNPCGLDGSDMFDSLNAGKLSVTLNLKHPEGLFVARRLVEWSHAVSENFAPRVMAGLGLDYRSLSKAKPDLVMASSCLMGQSGPERDYPGFGGQGAALSGYNWLTGWPDRAPVGPFGTITDSLAPRFVATAIAAGLYYRARTGRGVHLDVSQVEAAIFTLSPWVLDYVVNGHTGTRQGNRCETMCPHGAFRCAGEDRFVAIACWDDTDWERLCSICGWEPSLGAKCFNLEARKEHADEIEALLETWTCDRSCEEVAEVLQRAGIEAVPVADFADAWADAQLSHRGHFVTLDHPCMGRCGYERNGFRVIGERAGYDRPGPMLGQHNELVLGEILGIARTEQERLAEAGALD